MKLKTENIMKTLDSNHRVIIKCDIPGEKIKQVTITEGKVATPLEHRRAALCASTASKM
ncbi:hypothetical protein JLDGIFFK_00024 [Klebsiella phage vB_KppS-Samwise]|uniref:Uncharacterized protein n=1 Tax=Klebsiella phage vB_KppS-Samwise TaxID=2762815 RepID=A0A7R8MP23_9CAUD|nr:hypothetical protein OBHDAGOG_00052 [Klebsiella phage vB_KaS-Ahsoka]CAD5239504.1 hypothetical protein JLDGIFFK_00024 [Klebsiella phage vB_KppS-Samwise]CAD5239606.1 hypothetical protein EONHMLJF_00024 [Klebsiella phage vB_KaS-Gatomon]CAJ1038918.1 hypothetical protein SAMARA_00024 [Klebsiella phage vB_KppS-Samwise]CAJ1038997.1 hypothetical protein LLOFRUDD_00016 [Klebsiella phage vB_KppS-Samwise]